MGNEVNATCKTVWTQKGSIEVCSKKQAARSEQKERDPFSCSGFIYAPNAEIAYKARAGLFIAPLVTGFFKYIWNKATSIDSAKVDHNLSFYDSPMYK